MKRAISMIMVLVLALSMCVVGASAVESDAISETSATVGNERASWGYVKIRYDPNGAWGEGSINTYAGTAYYMYVKVYATYSNGDADGPSDTASGYNKESVVTDKIYENGPYRQYFVSGKIHPLLDISMATRTPRCLNNLYRLVSRSEMMLVFE